MKVLHIFRTIFRLAKGPEKTYKKGMNSTVDALNELVEIGEGFISAPGSIILAHDASTVIHTGKLRVEKTVIGKQVFLGANAVILPGIKVGDNAIIGAGAVVTKDVPPGMVVGGNPAKVLTSVEEYLNKCQERGVLYEMTEPTLKKHGTMERATPEETTELITHIYKQYHQRNPQHG